MGRDIEREWRRVQRAQDRFALERWRESGERVCPWCGAELNPPPEMRRVALDASAFLAELAKDKWRVMTRIVDAMRPGATAAEVAALLGCSERTVERARRKNRDSGGGRHPVTALLSSATGGTDGAGGLGTTEGGGAG